MFMTETELGNCMRALPRVKASPEFNSEVFRALHVSGAAGFSPPARVGGLKPTAPPFLWRVTAGFAMAAVLIAVLQVAALQYKRQQQLETMRAEQQQIQAELAAVKKSARETEPVVVLENDKGARVIMDLDSAAQHASYRTFD